MSMALDEYSKLFTFNSPSMDVLIDAPTPAHFQSKRLLFHLFCFYCRLIPLAVSLRQRNEIEMIAKAQGLSLWQIESESNLRQMSDQVLEAVFDGQ